MTHQVCNNELCSQRPPPARIVPTNNICDQQVPCKTNTHQKEKERALHTQYGTSSFTLYPRIISAASRCYAKEPDTNAKRQKWYTLNRALCPNCTGKSYVHQVAAMQKSLTFTHTHTRKESYILKRAFCSHCTRKPCVQQVAAIIYTQIEGERVLHTQ